MSSATPTSSSFSSSSTVDKFSISSLLWRAGWSPSGLLQFRNDPVPATLLSTLEKPAQFHHYNNNNQNRNRNRKTGIITNNNTTANAQQQAQRSSSSSKPRTTESDNEDGDDHDYDDDATAQSSTFNPNNYRTVGIPLNIPLKASSRCGGMLMENFETGHASLAPPGAYNSNDKNINNNIQSESSSTSRVSPGSLAMMSVFSSSEFVENQDNDDILLNSRCKISVESDGSFDTDFYLHNNVKSSPSVSGGSWFGGNEDALNEIDGMLFRIKVQIWSCPANNSSTTTTGSSSTSSAHSPAKRHIIGSFHVTRLWKEIKRFAILLHELHPELLVPLFAQLDAFNSNLNSTGGGIDASSSSSSNNDLEIRLDMIRSLVSSFQRNSPLSTHSPLVVMFLLEEDHDNFYKFLTTMEQQLKAQSEDRGGKLQQATEYKRQKDEAARNGETLATITVVRTKKEKEEKGFFASLFGGSSNSDSNNSNTSGSDGKKNQGGGNSNNNNSKSKSSHARSSSGTGIITSSQSYFPQTIVNMIPHTDEQIHDAETRVSTARFLIEDLNSELAKWQDAANSFVALDHSARQMLSMSQFLQDQTRDYSDTLVENTNEIIGANRNKVSFLKNVHIQNNSNAVASSSSSSNDLTLKSSPHSPLSGQQPSATSSSSNNNPLQNKSENSSTAAANQAAFTSGLEQVEAETKSNLRMAVMLMGSRAEALQGGDNMLSALSQSSKACLILSKSIVAHLQRHRILAERASQLSFVAQVDSENLLDFVIHTVRPISIIEVDVARKALRVQEHTMSVLFYSLSRQYCDSVLRCCATLQNESAMMQQEQEDQLGWTISQRDDE